jgi:hypothetical protein
MLWIVIWRQRQITGDIFGRHECIDGRAVDAFDSLEEMAEWVRSRKGSINIHDVERISYTFEVRTTVTTVKP